MPKPAAPLREEVPASAGKLFIPVELTPLPHTPSYARLTDRQRLRYNRLQALYFHEQITFFETALGRPVLAALLRRACPPRLVEALRQFREEEIRHTEMFRRLLRRHAPGIYAGRDFHFVQVSPFWAALLRAGVARPETLPLFLWLMLLQEERSVFYSRTYLAHREEIEPSFVEAHRLHLADEARHVRWDEELLDELWERARPLVRTVNARLFAWMLEEFFGAPKRAQLRVVEELAREHPELRGHLPRLRRELLALAGDEPYRRSLYSREIVPRTFARFDSTPEFRSLKICGYRPQPLPQGLPRPGGAW